MLQTPPHRHLPLRHCPPFLPYVVDIFSAPMVSRRLNRLLSFPCYNVMMIIPILSWMLLSLATDVTIASHSLSLKSERVREYLNPHLKFDFYNTTCPQLEKIVEERIDCWTAIDDTTPAPLLRLFFHDCFVYGCDASLLLNSSYSAHAEKDADINFSLGNFFVIDEIKERLEEVFPWRRLLLRHIGSYGRLFHQTGWRSTVQNRAG
ncbi:hypothetical protein KP509_38G028900 [Ceratopteris richardii]|uniref:Plant heme peroxidase family profile domain-containing protein n=1 Tax=Ceratopteris richardii TaxID=49495 RepID=A0A8T2Q2M1_CERRI|nr:hypothetical protein KP509_38G028900 [Ceratopteris richardii]